MSQSQDWQNGLSGCCSPLDSCLLSTCLPCIIFGRTSQRLDNPSGPIESINSDCAIFCAIQSFTGCGWIYNMMKRREIREKYGIEGSGMGDCCTSFWCLCCALVQQDKEVKVRTVPAYDAQGYQPVADGMKMP
ncbi:related to DUF614 domain protein [Fusarium mangiferae]|uniref:Related to DUF614 domain protein n=1 Tax=Fusarium mangiferae TaxID=192010 RepID=A0A1L7U6M2_FUSMA|nr:uncharacterized protein FMAN_03702 [Fusarium mangiferae]CVL06408.1 related to DUF614 domain protein [Fusarium mangiferae]